MRTSGATGVGRLDSTDSGGGADGVVPAPPAPPPARRRRERPTLPTVVAIAAAVLFVLIGIGTPLLGIGSFSGADLLLAREPWKSGVVTGFQAQIGSVSDTIDSVIATHHFYREQLTSGNVPVWNPLSTGGSPLGSGISYAVYSPINLPYLLLPTWLAPAYAKLLELAVAIGGTALFLRRLRVSTPAALVGGILFASSGFMVTWTNWPQTQVAAFIPALFWTAERFAQLRTARSAVPIGLVVAMMLLGGFPAVTGYACYAAAPYLLLRLAQLTGRNPLHFLSATVQAGLALGLGVGLVAVSLLPFLRTLSQLDYLEARGQTPDVKLAPLMLLTTGIWRAFGTVTGDGYWGPSTQIEGLSFIGAGALVLIGFGLLRRPGPDLPGGVRGFFVVATVVTVLLGYIGGPALELAQKLPVFSNNPVYRIRSVLGFFLAVLAALGYEALIRYARGRDRGRVRAVVETVGWLVGAVLAYLALQRLFATGASVGRLPYVHRQALWAAIPAALVFAAGMVATWRAPRVDDDPDAPRDPARPGPTGARAGGATAAGPRRPARLRTAALAVVPVVVAVESLSLVLAFWPRIPTSQFYPVTGAHRQLEATLGHERYAAKDLTLFTGTNVFYGLRNTTGHSFTETEWKELLLTADPKSFASPTFSTFSRNIGPEVLRSPLLDLLAVREFAVAASDPPIGRQSTAGAAGPGTRLEPGRPVLLPIGRGGLRGVGPVLTALARPTDRFAAVDLDVLDPAGTVLAHGSRRLYARVGPGPFVVPVAGEDLPTDTPLTARLTLRSDAPLAVAGGTAPQASVVRPAADGLRLEYADGAVIYRRTTAFPRFRWADHDQVIADKTRRLTVLANIREPGRVVLDEAPAAPAEGRPATVDVLTDGTDEMAVRVTAQGAGFLVVADSLSAGWQATLDGRPVPLVTADHALAAVRVPTGEHEVRLRYVAPGQRTGAAVSVLSLLALLGMVAATPLYRRAGPASDRTGTAGPAATATTAPGGIRTRHRGPRRPSPDDRPGRTDRPEGP